MTESRSIAERKAALFGDLRLAYQIGGEAAASVALSQRELSARYGLSARTVSLALKQLVEEGVLYTVPRVGTFLGRSRSAGHEPFLMIRPEIESGSYVNLMQSGFETRLGQLGGSSLALTKEELLAHYGTDELPAFAGQFDVYGDTFENPLLKAGLPCVEFENFKSSPATLDTVNFDNEEGGRQATHHLLQQGHRHIAFLALHPQEGDAGVFVWSALREKGWRRAMLEAGQEPTALAFHPPALGLPHDFDDQAAAAQKLMAEILANPKVTAIIAVNSFAARGLLNGLRSSGLQTQQWPAIFCFDIPESTDSVVSCMNLPWEQIGIEAAQLLWERRHGGLKGPAVQRLVPMRLIPRLTCRPDWANSALARKRVDNIGINLGAPKIQESAAL